MTNYRRMTIKQKHQLKEMFQLGMTPVEAEKKFPFGIDTIRNYFRGYRNQGIARYTKEELNDAQSNS